MSFPIIRDRASCADAGVSNERDRESRVRSRPTCILAITSERAREAGMHLALVLGVEWQISGDVEHYIEAVELGEDALAALGIVYEPRQPRA